MNLNTLASNLAKSIIAILIWPAICIGILIVDMAFIWKMDTHKSRGKGQGGKGGKPIAPDTHTDIAGGSPDKVTTDTTAAINWDEVAVYYPYKDGNS